MPAVGEAVITCTLLRQRECMILIAWQSRSTKKEPARRPAHQEKLTVIGGALESAPKGIRIPVAALKGRCPMPLDDGGNTLLILAGIRRPVKSPRGHGSNSPL